MDNMKARAFIEAETPDITVPEGDGIAVAEKARDFVAAANVSAGALGQAVKIALYGEDADKRIKRLNDTTPLTTTRDRFWADTNDHFFATLNNFSKLPVKELVGEAAMPFAQSWRAVLERAALAIFDDMAPVHDALSPNVKRVVGRAAFFSYARCSAMARAASSCSRTWAEISPCPKP